MQAEVIITSAITGLGAGTIGAIVGPWSQWGVEKRRVRQNYRQRMIAEWRAMIAKFVLDEGAIKPQGLLSHPSFVSLRAHLSPAALKILEHSPDTITVIGDAEGIAASPELSLLCSEIDRLERRWRLH
jgi:hypothetical protein